MDAALKPNTILMTADTVGGVWTYALELAEALGRHRVRVVLAAMGGDPSDSQLEAAAGVDSLVLEARPYKLEWMQDPWDEVEEAGEWLLRLEAKYRPSIIHLNNFAHGSLPWSAPALVVAHSCVWSWFHEVRDEAPSADWSTYGQRVASGLAAADAVTAPTEAMLDWMRQYYGYFRAVGAVHNARRSDAFRPLPPKPYVLTAGRLWDEAKNVHLLDAAAAQIRVPVMAAGPVQNPDGGQVQFANIDLLGMLPQGQLAHWMGHAAIYALPARYEPFGLTALEAAHAGCALVLGDVPTLREVWRDAAIFVAPNDVGAIADAVNRLIEDDWLRRSMAARASRRAADFTPEGMALSYLRLYEQLQNESALIAEDRPALRNVQDQAVERAQWVHQ